MPSPSVSAISGSVPAVVSSSVVKPSLSQSPSATAAGLGSHASVGSVLLSTSIPSGIPSPSVSGFSGSVFAICS